MSCYYQRKGEPLVVAIFRCQAPASRGRYSHRLRNIRTSTSSMVPIPTPLPACPGTGSGRVKQVGSESTQIKVGDHVVTYLSAFAATVNSVLLRADGAMRQ
jgi:hypothetical protein